MYGTRKMVDDLCSRETNDNSLKLSRLENKNEEDLWPSFSSKKKVE